MVLLYYTKLVKYTGSITYSPSEKKKNELKICHGIITDSKLLLSKLLYYINCQKHALQNFYKSFKVTRKVNTCLRKLCKFYTKKMCFKGKLDE